MLGIAQVKVQHENKENNLPVVVVGGEGPNLLGRSWPQVQKIVSSSPVSYKYKYLRVIFIFLAEL